ncbi:coniferyl-alcohol glucosyltransferase [Vigna unguiculata]|uniref:Coniferyl-alcohol glucosyltransferase n=1 Tax=Vigna unguiculata TaxID=3917 RepID=A0A4D6MKB1_VIGUN|nr:coniferyl-alcohol glucosyltransferase [Vigna unguiculata]
MDQTEPIKIPSYKPIRSEDVFDPMLDRNDKQYTEYLKIANKVLQSDNVLVNTWEELQREELKALREGGSLREALNMKIPTYAVGPLVREPLLETKSSTESLVTWLDQQSSKSVVYVSFGSGGMVSSAQMKELDFFLA